MNVVGYIRVSTQTQVERGYGLDVQRDRIRQFCREKGWTLVKVYEDRGVSGAQGDSLELLSRMGLQELLANCSGDTRGVVVLNTNRLWRDDVARAIIQVQLRKKKVEVYSIEQPDYSIYQADPTHYLVNGMMELLDSYQRLEIAVRLRRGRAKKAQKGLYATGAPPLGYRKGRGGVLEADPERADLVREMYRRYLRMKSAAKVAASLNADGYRTARGGLFTQWPVQTILQSDFYLGWIRWQGQRIRGQHKPIVSRNIWGRVQKTLKRKSSSK